MNAIKIYLKNDAQATIFQSLAKELKLKHELEKVDDTKMDKNQFIKKINDAAKEIEEGKFITVNSKKQLKELLSL